jgi:hypothetical protein
MKQTPNSRVIQIVVLLFGIMILYACNSTTPEDTATIPPSATRQPNATVTQTPTTEAPPATPILSKTLVVLVSPPGADAIVSDQLSLTLSELAASEGLDFEVRPSFSQEDLSTEIKLLVAIPPDPGLSDLARAAPGTQFLGIIIPGLEPADNLTVIRDDMLRPDNMGFLAGYLAAVVTPEWRVGTISNSDSTEGVDHRQGFLNGAIYFCGLCRQTYPPYNNYPLYAEAPAAASPQEWQTAADSLIDNAAQTVYIAPGISDETLLEYFAAAEINLIGTTSPPPGLEDQWIATISGDILSVLHTIWPELMADQGGLALAAPLSLTNINPDLFSPGRQRLVEKMIAELSAGFIDTGVGTNLSSP